MEEELHLLRDLYASAARKNLAEEHFYNFMTVKYGGVPPEVPAGMRKFSRLSDMNYNPNLDDVTNDIEDVTNDIEDVTNDIDDVDNDIEPRHLIIEYFSTFITLKEGFGSAFEPQLRHSSY